MEGAVGVEADGDAAPAGADDDDPGGDQELDGAELDDGQGLG
ncbi:MAG: hypothetical protein ACRDYF_06020 [Acidimicrobiia bacterium]